MLNSTTRRLLAAFLALLSGPPALGSDEPEPVHWAYSSFFGTGWYQVDANRSVFVLRLSPRQVLSRPAFEDGDRTLGVEIHYPLTLGMHNLDFEDLPGNLYPSNFGTASFTPGVDLEIPITSRFSLRPSVRAGMGIEFESKDKAWIWEAGVKGRYTLPASRVQWSLLGEVNVAGHNADGAPADHVSGLLFGFEARQPLRREFRGQGWDLNWHASYAFLDRELRFDNGDGTYRSVNDIIQLSIALSPRDRNFRFWGWSPEQLGLGIKFSPDGEFAAVTFSSRSWFSK